MEKSNLLEDIKKYFSETSEEKIKSDWNKLKKWDKVGVSINEFIKSNLNKKS